jgi:hypothetical protein
MRILRDARVAGAAVAMLGLLLWVTPARAQGDAAIAARRDLLVQAQVAHDAGDHARALDLATRAGQIQMTPSVRMFIAQEQAAIGHLADALGGADLCVREAERDATLRNRDAIIAQCRGLIASLQPRVARVVVRVPSPPPDGLRVTVAGGTLNEAFYGVPYVVTPGTVRVEATAPGQAAFARDVAVSVGGVAEVSVALAPGSGAAQRPPSLVGPIVLITVGGASLAASIAFFVLRGNALAGLDAFCSPADAMGVRNCDATDAARDTFAAASTHNALAFTTLAVGGAAVAGGVAWLVAATRPRGESRGGSSARMRWHVAPLVGGGAVFGIGGRL